MSINPFDTNGGDTSSAFDLIPAGTVARAIVKIRPGGSGDGGWFKLSKAGDLMLDLELTIVEGPYAKRKIWTNMMVTGSEKAVEITRTNLRALVEAHYGLNPDDMSPEAQEKRRVDPSKIDGMIGCIKIGIEKSEGYADKNSVSAFLGPKSPSFLKPGQFAATPLGVGGGGGSSPQWGAGGSGGAGAPATPAAGGWGGSSQTGAPGGAGANGSRPQWG